MKDFRYFMKKHRLLTLGLLFFQMFFSMVILFVIGIFYSNKYEQNSTLAAMKNLNVEVGNFYRKSQFVDAEIMVSSFLDIFGKYEDIMISTGVHSEGVYEGTKYPVVATFKLTDGKYVPGDFAIEKVVEGRVFNTEDYNNGKRTIIIPMALADGHHETIIFGGEEYEVLAYQVREANSQNGLGWENTCFIPFKSLSNNLFTHNVSVTFKRPLFKSEYDDIKAKVEVFWGDKAKVSKYIQEDLGDKSVKATVNFIVVVVAFLVSVTLCSFYYCIIIRKRKLNAVNVLCGLSVRKVILRQILEVSLITATNTALGCVLYLNFIKKLFEKQFIWFSAIYSEIKYVNIMSIYAIIIMFINAVFIFWIMNKKPIEILRDAKRA